VIRHLPVGLEEALAMTLQRLGPLGTRQATLLEAVDRVVAEDLYAKVDSPSVNASLKDGYAIRSTDVADAARRPVKLNVTRESAAAGGRRDLQIEAGCAMRILTGAKIPSGADAVLSEEFVENEGAYIIAGNAAEPGRNILARGSDVAVGDRIVDCGVRLTPGMIGLLAAAGYSTVPINKAPRAAIIATGDEVVAPGRPLSDGKLYASNITTLGAWCRRYAISADLTIVPDDADAIMTALRGAMASTDAVITSGGAWTGDRDLVARILERMGWRQVYHRIRIGPGKAVGFGMLQDKPVFILPGGPPSNLMGFLQIALPGLLTLAGYQPTGLPERPVRLATDVNGRFADWTQFVYGEIEEREDGPVFHSLAWKSRLQSMAMATAIVAVPEGKVHLPAGTVVTVQCLT
jgi:molybdopterin molybdotransferase